MEDVEPNLLRDSQEIDSLARARISERGVWVRGLEMVHCNISVTMASDWTVQSYARLIEDSDLGLLRFRPRRCMIRH